MVLDEVKDKYKEYAKFFQEYDRPPQHEHQPIATKEKNLDPFKKINWKNLYDSNELNRFHYKLVDDKLVWAYIISESKSNRGIKDIADDIVGRIDVGDLQITRFAYHDDYIDDLISDIQSKRELTTDFFTTRKDLWFTDVNMELEKDKKVLEKLNGRWLSSKITAVGSEVRGIYYCGEKEQLGVQQHEDITIKKMELTSINKDECKELVNEIINYKDALNPWSYDGINGNYGGPEKTWYTIEIVPIRPDSETDYEILKRLPKLNKIVEDITSVEKCTWLVVTRVEPNNGLIQRHTDIGNDSWKYKTKNGPKVGQSFRVHFPLQVDDDCVFTQVGLDGKEIDHRLKVAEYYYMDKRKPHWVRNESDNYRFHVIMDFECEQRHLDALL